ncbi:MAG: response regulator [Kiritimatiellae bacterium]|nr:response regulator [Kiritimatiellia bacterium]
MPYTPENNPPLRILAVDDEPAVRDVYRIGLEQFGFEIETAASGREGLQIMMQQTFDVLVVDVKMTEMNGIAFLQEALKIWPWAGVVLVSGHITPAIEEEARKLGVHSTMHKPVALKELRDHIVAAAEEKKPALADLPRSNALTLLKDHLKLLSSVDEKSLGTSSLVDALLEFGRDLSGMMPSDVVGIMVIEQDESVLLFACRHSVHPMFLTRLEHEMFARYQAISGEGLDRGHFDTRSSGAECSDTAPDTPRGVISVPVILGKDVCGLITLASAGTDSYSPTDVSLLYHASNHIAAVFMALRRMHHLATRDPLSGLYNRIRMEEELERAWDSSRRYDPAVSVVVVDIDHFKILNDTYGHAAGDEILSTFAKIMIEVGRGSDIMSRLGGDEFVAILPIADEGDARVFSERLLHRTRKHIFCPDSHRLNITISLGIAASNNPDTPKNSAELLTQADRALYQAKRAGRNRICVWRGEGAQESQSLEQDTKRDANENEVVLGGKAHARIIVVDDEPAILRLISALLERDNYEVQTFTSAAEAVQTIRNNPAYYDIILTDIAMPDMSGIELLQDLKDADDLIVKIVMTGYASVDNAVTCLREGAYDFVQKPVDAKHFSAVLKRALEYRGLRMEHVRHQAQLERMVAQRSAQLSKILDEVKASYEFTLEAFMSMLDAREKSTGRHSLRVRELSIELARRMGVRGKELDAVATGALLHDIGKIGVPDRVLFHDGPLSDDDWDIMQSHALKGHKILESSPQLASAAQIVFEHHERYDGSGYPQGLKGNQICLGARIFAVIDAFDAMRSKRIYRNPMTIEETSQEILKNSGIQFDPEVVEAFFHCKDALEEMYQLLSSQEAPTPTLQIP